MPGRLLAAAPAEVRVCPAGEPLGAGARSWVSDGRVVLWAPPATDGVRVALDAEVARQLVPPAVARRAGTDDPEVFWPLWTSVEVSCKLTEVPLSRWLRERGLRPDEALAMRTFVLDDLVVTCGAVHLASR